MLEKSLLISQSKERLWDRPILEVKSGCALRESAHGRIEGEKENYSSLRT